MFTNTRSSLCLAVAITVILISGNASANDWYVNNVTGSDDNTGASVNQPLRTIGHALGKTKPGDTVHLAATGTLYRQMVDFYGHSGGKAGKPVTLDGHGATLSGAEPCPPDGWSVYRDDVLMRDDIVSRLFLLVDGEMVFGTSTFNVLRPGEVCYMPNYFKRLFFHPPKGMKAGDCKIEVGQPDGSTVTLDPAKWQRSHSRIGAVLRYNGLKPPTWVRVNGKEVRLVKAQDRLEPGQWCVADKVMYYRPPVGKQIAELNIECIVRANGVQMNGSQSHFVIKNLNVQHVYNDGYNIHGEVTNAEFYNCNAANCGDEGFSAHGACETLLDGAVYENCDNGIANVNTAGRSDTRNVIVRNSRSVGFLLISKGTARHTLKDSIFIDNPAQLSIADVAADNVLIVNTTDSTLKPTAINCGRNTQLRRFTVVGNGLALRVGAQTSAKVTESLFGPGQMGVHARCADPSAVLSSQKVRFASDLAMEWGVRYPWKKVPMNQWLSSGDAKDEFTDVQVDDLTGLNPLRDGKAPTFSADSIGCTADLIEQYRRFIKR